MSIQDLRKSVENELSYYQNKNLRDKNKFFREEDKRLRNYEQRNLVVLNLTFERLKGLRGSKRFKEVQRV